MASAARISTAATAIAGHRYARPEIRAGVAGLPRTGWCSMPGATHPQFTDVIALARAVPQARIVMCHIGGVLGYGAYAGKKDEIHAAWRANMAELATCPKSPSSSAAC
jgi:L-fuconolactonase